MLDVLFDFLKDVFNIWLFLWKGFACLFTYDFLKAKILRYYEENNDD